MSIKQFRAFLFRAFPWLRESHAAEQAKIASLEGKLNALAVSDDPVKAAYMARVAELVEARQMAGSGPWQVSPDALLQTDRIIQEAYDSYTQRLPLREALPGGLAQFELGTMMLGDGQWRRDLAAGALEFSQWGIQQIILLNRLRYLKNPVMRRLIDVTAAYVFARGVDVSCPDPDGNDVIEDFFERNKRTLGQVALVDLQRRKGYDGNLFFVLFADKVNTGLTNCRTIDATEIQEIITDPEDSDTPWFYRRVWSAQTFDAMSGESGNTRGECWYPAIGYDPPDKPLQVRGIDVKWASPVYHRKCGGVGKWLFGLPEMYAAGPWAIEAERYLERCASVMAALAEIAKVYTTKGGAAAVAGLQEQLQTTISPTDIWGERNPTAVPGSSLATTPGMTVEAFKTQGAGLDPKNVSWFARFACMVAGVPPHFIGDVEDTNRATATSLDRPTETIILEKQEAWSEDLAVMASYALQVSLGASRGKLREALERRKLDPGSITIREARREYDKQGRWRYVEADAQDQDDMFAVRAEFPAIREGDIPELVTAVVAAMGAGMDKKEGVRKLGDLIGLEGNDELVEEQFPEATYERDKTATPPPVPPTVPPPPGQQPPQPDQPAPLPAQVEAALQRVKEALA